MADQETAKAFERVEKLIVASSEAQRALTSEFGEKLHSIDLKVTKIITQVGMHEKQDEKDFDDVRKRLDGHDAKWWQLLLGSAGGGGIVGGIIHVFTKKSGG